jgi:hypothetical protein
VSSDVDKVQTGGYVANGLVGALIDTTHALLRLIPLDGTIERPSDRAITLNG